jgi:hypothetical protein
MRLCAILVFAALNFGPTAAWASEASLLTAPQEQTEIQLALDRGTQLFNYDQAAWHTTDALLVDVPDPSGAGIRGWVVTPNDRGLRVTYFGVAKSTPFGIYSAIWAGKEVIDRKRIPPGPESKLSPDEQRLVAARDAAHPDGLSTCAKTKPFNTIILPGRTSADPISVYYLTPQTQNDLFPLGGHHRIDVKDGKVAAKRTFTKSCVDLNRMQQGSDDRVAAFVISHLLDPTPTEIHVFSVLAAEVPMYVSTISNKAIWAVEISGGKARVRRMAKDGAKTD